MKPREKIQRIHKNIIDKFDSNESIYKNNIQKNGYIKNITTIYDDILQINLLEDSKENSVKDRLYDLHNYISLYILNLDEENK